MNKIPLCHPHLRHAAKGLCKPCYDATRYKSIRPAFADRFWSRVIKTEGCWIWSGTKTTVGYGKIVKTGTRQTYLAHRVSWQLTTGEELRRDQWLLHSCNNPSCVNPAHLRIGTPKENTRDAIQAGTHCSTIPFIAKAINVLSKNGYIVVKRNDWTKPPAK